jgi:hypothetical protein
VKEWPMKKSRNSLVGTRRKGKCEKRHFKKKALLKVE